MGKRELTNNWTKGYCFTVVKDLSTFVPCPKTLWEAGFHGERLIYLREEMSRLPSIQCMA